MRGLSNDEIEAGFGPRRRLNSDANPQLKEELTSAADIAAQVETRRSKIRHYTRVGLKNKTESVHLITSEVPSGASSMNPIPASEASEPSGEFDPFSDIPNLNANINLSPRPTAASQMRPKSDVSEFLSNHSAATQSESRNVSPSARSSPSSSSSSYENDSRSRSFLTSSAPLNETPASSAITSNLPTSNLPTTPLNSAKQSDVSNSVNQRVPPKREVRVITKWPPGDPVETESGESARSSEGRERARSHKAGGFVKRTFGLSNPFKKKKTREILTHQSNESITSSANRLAKNAPVKRLESDPPLRIKSTAQLKPSKIQTLPLQSTAPRIAYERAAIEQSKIAQSNESNSPFRPILVDPDLYKINQELIEDRIQLIEDFETQIKELGADKASTENMTLKDKVEAMETDLDDLRTKLTIAEQHVAELIDQNQSLNLSLIEAEKQRMIYVSQIEAEKPLLDRYLERIALNEQEIEELRKERDKRIHAHDISKCDECAMLISRYRTQDARKIEQLEEEVVKLGTTQKNKEAGHEVDRAKLTAIIADQKSQIERMSREISNFFTSGAVSGKSNSPKNKAPPPTAPPPEPKAVVMAKPDVKKKAKPTIPPPRQIQAPQIAPNVAATKPTTESPPVLPRITDATDNRQAPSPPSAAGTPPIENPTSQAPAPPLRHEAVCSYIALAEKEESKPDMGWRVLEPNDNRYFGCSVYAGQPKIDHSAQWNPLWCNRAWHYGTRQQFIDGEMQASDIWQYRWVNGRYQLEGRGEYAES